MSSAVLTPTGSVESNEITGEAMTDPFRAMICEMIREGLSELRWGWKQSIPTSLRKSLTAGGSSSITLSLVKSIITDAEATGAWAPGWAEAQLTEARAVQRLSAPRSRHAFVARGSQVGNSELTEQKVRAIRRTYAARYKRLERAAKTTIKSLASKYNVHPMTIRRVLQKETWTHV